MELVQESRFAFEILYIASLDSAQVASKDSIKLSLVLASILTDEIDLPGANPFCILGVR